MKNKKNGLKIVPDSPLIDDQIVIGFSQDKKSVLFVHVITSVCPAPISRVNGWTKWKAQVILSLRSDSLPNIYRDPKILMIIRLLIY